MIIINDAGQQNVKILKAVAMRITRFVLWRRVFW